MTPPAWARWLLRWLASSDHADEVLGDLEEVHRDRVRRRGRMVASLLTGLEALDMAVALIRERIRRRGTSGESIVSRVTAAGIGPKFQSVSWLDLKLGLRMLAKYPGLTLVGGLGITVATAIGAGSFGIIYTIMEPALPLDEGDRIVTIQNMDATDNQPSRSTHLHDLVTWDQELESVEDLGAYRPIGRNLVAPDGQVEPVRIAEMTASGFRVARVPPLLGRFLLEADEREGAPPVVVIGYDVWQNRFAGDPGILGRTLQLGAVEHEVVGVMPEDFAFPVNHRFWVPLRLDPLDFERGQAPSVWVFGRLAPGVTLDEARAELTTIGRRMAAEFPETYDRVRPRILPYAYPFVDIDDPATARAFHLLQVLVSMLLIVVAVNVAILVYARTATRVGEIAVRSAIGASRRRIVMQLFVEALVLSTVAAAVGLVLASVALGQVNAFMAQLVGGRLPFWMDFGLSAGAVVYVAGLAVLAAVIVGVVPALKATGRRVQIGLQRLGSGATGMRLGRIWTVLIVAQVAVAVAILPVTVYSAGESIRYGFTEPGFAAQEFLVARLSTRREIPARPEAESHERELRSRSANLQAELVRRLRAEAAVSDVILTMAVPGKEPRVWVEVEGAPMPAELDDPDAVRSGSAGHRVGIGRVDIGFFGAFDVPILAGRRFDVGDLDAGASAAIANRSFVRRILGGGNALGRRVRYVGRSGDVSPANVELGRWYEIVGVVPDFPNRVDPGVPEAKLYHALAPGEIDPAHLAIRVSGAAPERFTRRLRAIGAALDPTLQLSAVRPLDEALREEQGMMRLVGLGVTLVTLSVLLLSAAGIYALMSFTVARRRREIGIRAALGADPRRLLASVFSRAAGQLALGISIGAAVAALLLTKGGLMDGHGAAVLLPAVSGLMMAVGLLAALGPARRGLRVQPTEALREE